MIDIALAALGLLGDLFGWATRELRIAIRASRPPKQLGVPVHRKLPRIAISAPEFSGPL